MARKTEVPAVRADFIKQVLQKKHAQETFFTEVKTGPTIAASSSDLQKIDALAIKPSWSNPCFTAYEVKVSRNDFMRDDKWANYRNYCHRFYFACPSGLIKPEELPEDVGLVWVNADGGYSVRRAALFRPIEIPWEMLYYLVISRMDHERHPFFSSRREYFEAFVADRADRAALKYRVSTKWAGLLKELQEKVSAAEHTAKKAEKGLKALEVLREFNVYTGYGDDFNDFELRQRLTTGAGKRAVAAVQRAAVHLQEAMKQLQALEEQQA
ncbi:MAG TPA: MmcB family DNA repair protein [Symbiobacteriaceae bacterium]|nr:MmcB family DNA repair protein [Symbiobacteriaceae bacterium]